MKLSEIRALHKKAQRGEFISFDYKKDNGETSKRTLRIGGDVAAKLARQGTPIQGKHNWISEAKKEGKNGFLFYNNGRVYLRGTDLKDSRHKVFILENLSNLH